MALLSTSSVSAGLLPAAVAAPLAVPAAVGYAHAVPQNVPPFASRVDISSRVRAAPLIAAAPGVYAPAAPLQSYIAAPALHPYAAVAPALHPYSAAAPFLI